MRKSFLIFLGVGVIPLCLLHAQDSLKTQVLEQVVVTGTKFELPIEKSGKFIFKVGQDQLQTGRNLGDILNEVPGIQMDGNFGTPGTNLSYYVRGARNKSSLILLDGVPMNDPSGIDPGFDLRLLSSYQVNSMEVLQGGLSTLYGSSATASVINIQTKNTNTQGIHGGLDINAGSWNSFGQNLNLSGRNGKASFQFYGSNYNSTGFSSAQDSTDSFDKDGFERKNGLLKIRYTFNPKLTVDVFGGIDWVDSEFDQGAFIDGNNTQKQVQERIGIKGTWNYEKGYATVTIQNTGLTREYTGTYPEEYDATTWFGEITHKHEFNSVLTILDGVSLQKMSYGQPELLSKDSTSFTIVDPYFSLLLDLPVGLNLHAGVRMNSHSEYGTKLIYNFNPSWRFHLTDAMNFKVFASASTSYITPTLFQLHSVWGGNIDLRPEESLNLEYGASFMITNKFTVTAVNYYREEKDVIGYTFQYENISAKRYVKGVTFDVRYTLNEKVSLNSDFSWVTSNDEGSFYRIPAHKAGFALKVQPMNEATVTLRYQYTGKRTDLYYDEFFISHEIKLSAYSLLDLTVSQNLLKNRLLLYGSIFNVLDEDFVGVYGYTTRGRNFSVGITYNF